MDMYNSAAQMRGLMEVLKGQQPADLRVSNVRILDVYTERVYEGVILAKDGRIAAVTPNARQSAKQEFDAEGMVAVPGFIDAHFHLDFPLVTPAELSHAIVPRGTTAMNCEVLDLAAMKGMGAVEALVKDRDALPYRCLMAAPGKVAPKYATEAILGWKDTVCLGEMNQNKVENGDADELDKIAQARRAGKVISGHVIGRAADEIDVYAIAGFDDEHNTDTYGEAVDRLRFGMRHVVRSNGAYNAVDEVVGGCLRDGIPTDNLLFGVDDIYIHDIFKKGHLDVMIQRAIDIGLSPAKAIKIATLNAARHFRIDHLLGSIVPGRYADFVLLENLDVIKPRAVFQNGRLVAREGQLVAKPAIDYSPMKSESVSGLGGLSSDDLSVTADMPATRLYDIANGEKVSTSAYLPLAAAPAFHCLVEKDILPYYTFQRYPAHGSRKIYKNYIRGTKMRKGALAISFEQGGSAISAVGTNAEDILCAAREVDRHPGGMAAVLDGKILASFPLPLAGTCSDLPAAKAAAALDELEAAVRSFGCDLDAVLMRLYFLPFYYVER